MFNLFNKHPFISGVIVGIIGVRAVGRGIRNMVDGNITIIQLTLEEPERIEEPKIEETEIK